MSREKTVPLYSLEVIDPTGHPTVLSVIYTWEVASGHTSLNGRLSGPMGQPLAETHWKRSHYGRNAALEILRCMVRDLEDMTDPF